MREEILLQGTQAELNGRELSIKGDKGTVTRKFVHPLVKINLKDDKIVLETKKERKKEKRIIKTYKKHVQNMIIGVNKGFRYTLAVVQSHFPIQPKVEGNKFILSNFIGETVPRTTRIPDGVSVTVNKKEEKIIVESPDIEKAGQTVTLLEHLTKIKKKDPRVFQDGIYLTNREVIQE